MKTSGDEYRCEQCGARFVRVKKPAKNRGQPRFCSTKCMGDSRVIVRTHLCEQCGTEFSVKTKRPARFCSLACVGASRIVIRSCQHCGSPFRPTSSKRATAKFCSKQCHGSFRAQDPEAVAHMRAIHPKGAEVRSRRAGNGPHGVTRYGHGCRCDVCVSAFKQMTRRQTERLIRETRPTAHRSHYQWTGPELELAARTDLTAIEVAQMIGRTAFAVAHKRSALKVDPRAINLAGLPSRAREVEQR